MNTFVNTLYRDFTCGAAAILITLVMSAGLVQSTNAAPGTHALVSTAVTGQSRPV